MQRQPVKYLYPGCINSESEYVLFWKTDEKIKTHTSLQHVTVANRNPMFLSCILILPLHHLSVRQHLAQQGSKQKKTKLLVYREKYLNWLNFCPTQWNANQILCKRMYVLPPTDKTPGLYVTFQSCKIPSQSIRDLLCSSLMLNKSSPDRRNQLTVIFTVIASSVLAATCPHQHNLGAIFILTVRQQYYIISTFVAVWGANRSRWWLSGE